jgi:hypothetical protein
MQLFSHSVLSTRDYLTNDRELDIRLNSRPRSHDWRSHSELCRHNEPLCCAHSPHMPSPPPPALPGACEHHPHVSCYTLYFHLSSALVTQTTPAVEARHRASATARELATTASSPLVLSVPIRSRISAFASVYHVDALSVQMQTDSEFARSASRLRDPTNRVCRGRPPIVY